VEADEGLSPLSSLIHEVSLTECIFSMLGCQGFPGTLDPSKYLFCKYDFVPLLSGGSLLLTCQTANSLVAVSETGTHNNVAVCGSESSEQNVFMKCVLLACL
jgi:hypothetical protein